MVGRLCLPVLSISDVFSQHPHEAAVAEHESQVPRSGLGIARTAFAAHVVNNSLDPPRRRDFREIEGAIVEERKGDGRLCIKGTEGCGEMKITDPKKDKTKPGLSGPGDVEDIFSRVFARSAAPPTAAPEGEGPDPFKATSKTIKNALESAALRGQGEGVPPIDPQSGSPVRISDLWKWVSNIQMRRARQAANIADHAVQEAWKQQRLARYYSHEALKAEAAAIRAIPKPESLEADAPSKPGFFRYSVPPELKKFYETQKVPPGWELPPAPLVDPKQDKMMLRVTSDSVPAFALAPPRELSEKPRLLRPVALPAAFL
uniref:Uncharacterized protein n=1 Tax=Alexandrium monilatum TaxID=311494 RepID=A0A7S4QXJ0_9DINO